VAVREFDGTDDAIALLPGALATATSGPYTYAVLAKRQENSENGLFAIGPSFTVSGSAFSVGKASMWCGNTTSTGVKMQTTATNCTSTLLWTQADDWCVIVLTKATGAVTPRYHKRVLGTSTTTRQSSAANGSDLAFASGDRIVIANDQFANRFAMRLAVFAFWPVTMSDGEVDALWAGLATNDWYNHSVGTPLGLWEFNQANVADDVLDLTGGGADETGIVGTTVIADGVDDPPGWTFGLSEETWPPEGTENAPETLRVVQPALRLN
jgi:hypothetical protein